MHLQHIADKGIFLGSSCPRRATETSLGYVMEVYHVLFALSTKYSKGHYWISSMLHGIRGHERQPLQYEFSTPQAHTIASASIIQRH